MNEYTTIDYWDTKWDTQTLQHFIEQGINRQILKIITSVLSKGSKVLEIGCVPARRLYFLRNHFQVETYGLDYSLKGLLNSTKTQNHLVCSDLYYIPFKDESFDLVYSLGLIEHFSVPTEVIRKHLNMLKHGGFLVITIPNFHRFSLMSCAYKLARKYKEVEDTHNMKVMQKCNFKKLFESFPLDPLISDYYGPLVILSPPKVFLRRLCTRINNLLDKAPISSRIFSPDLVFIGKKR